MGITDCATTAYAEHSNYCVLADGADANQDGGHEHLTLDACKTLCDTTPGCTGLEFYKAGWNGKTCFLFQEAIDHGSEGGQWRDAQCFVKVYKCGWSSNPIKYS